jgi:hypothetical protein
MTFSGASNFRLDVDLGQTLDIPSINVPNLSKEAFSPSFNIGTLGFTGNFDFGADSGIPKLDVPDYSSIFQIQDRTQTQAQNQNSFQNLLKGIFELPSMLAIGKGILQGAGAAAAYQNRAAESQIATAAANQRYWAQYADQVSQNYRQYQVQLDSYYRDLDYAQRRRDYEDQLSKQQSEYKGAVATQAFKNFERQIADLEGRFYEEEAKETIEMENIRIQSIAAASKAKAKGQVGRSIERINNQYHQQYLANLSNREITRNYRIADKIRQAEALDVARQNTSNQIQFYTPQPIPDPVKPLAPLPITAVPPTPETLPSGTALTMDLTNIGLDALRNYQSMQPQAPKPIGQ